MSHLSKLFTSKPVDIPNRSGFDLSFNNLLTMPVGTLVPVLCEEAIPNETYNLGYMANVQLPPMATNFFGRVDMRLEAFFVPNRILWHGWQNFWTQPDSSPYATPTVRPTQVPSGSADFDTYLGTGSLADYLGMKANLAAWNAADSSVPIPNILPFVAYHKIWDDWYRNSRIQKPAFVNSTNNLNGNNLYQLPWTDVSRSYSPGGTNKSALADGVEVWSLRQRNWAKDYFTTATLYPAATQIAKSVQVNTDTNEFTIPDLRQANVFQRWAERNNIAGARYGDQIKAQYGVLPADAILDRPVLLGSSKFGVYSNSCSTTAENVSDTSSNSKNPFASMVGSKAGQSQGVGEDSLINSFKVTEHGYIIVLASLVPHANYASGCRRQMMHSEVGDFAIPLLQGLGEQPIYKAEILGDAAAYGERSIFGYTQQYAEYKYHDDEVHGQLREGNPMQAFCLQRMFADVADLGSSFLEIGKDAMDNVLAASFDTGATSWANFYFVFKKISPLSEYVIPTLGDLKNTHKESIPLGGRQL